MVVVAIPDSMLDATPGDSCEMSELGAGKDGLEAPGGGTRRSEGGTR